MHSASSRFMARLGLALVAVALIGIGLGFFAPRPAFPADDAPAAKPAKKDSNPRIRPKEVTLTAAVKPAEARAGEDVAYQVTARLEPGWHIYKYTKEPQGQGPRNTTFDFFDTAGLERVGDWTASTPPISKKEPAFENMVLDFHEDEVSWVVSLRIPDGTEPGEKTLRCQAGYQICDASSCKIPGQWALPDVVLTVLPGGAKTAGAPPAPPVQPEVQTPSPPPAPVRAVAVSEVARKAELGLIPFLLFSALGGVGALVMPCVWPMVPITVNFFVKQGQGQSGKGKTTGLAIAYCLAIIGVFTAVGVLCAFFFSAAALQNFANNGWLNVFVAALFLAFGLSLLGLFEVRLPNFLLNASSQGEGRGGLLGVVFMALTLTITSFTCTFPVVGGLIVMASKGQFFYPIIGLATFSTVLALPFFLLALSPGLLSKMPKSGDWLNAVKVVGGLVEIGAAFKFINTAEVGFGAIPKDAWFDAPVVLTIWVVLAAVCGLYLLGIFRTDHDYEEVKIGPGRLVLGSLMLFLSLYLAPALFGRPPQSKLWYSVVGLLPLDVNKLNPAPALAAGGPSGEQDATSKDPEKAQAEQTSFHGVPWTMSYKAGLARAREQNKPVLIDFTGANCANCRKMENEVMPQPEVVKLLKQFVTVSLYTDFPPIASLTPEQRDAIRETNQNLLIEMTQANDNPYYVAVTPDGQVLEAKSGFIPTATFTEFLNRVLNKHQDRGKVASAASR